MFVCRINLPVKQFDQFDSNLQRGFWAQNDFYTNRNKLVA